MADLWYRQIPVIPAAYSLPDQLMEFLARQLWQLAEPGQIPHSLKTGPVVVGPDNVRVTGFLEGLAATGVDGAQELLEAVQDAGSTGVVLWIGEASDNA